MDLSWMAWTGPTAAFFIFILLALTTMVIWERQNLFLFFKNNKLLFTFRASN